jgi:hypothetical protein
MVHDEAWWAAVDHIPMVRPITTAPMTEIHAQSWTNFGTT